MKNSARTSKKTFVIEWRIGRPDLPYGRVP